MDITTLSWLAGTWRGTLGERSVEENWGSPSHGGMEARVRLANDEGLTTIELIGIREHEDTLVLLLRQYSPLLEVFNSQTLTLSQQGERTATFRASEDDMIAQLHYDSPEEDQLRITVTLASGDAVTAELRRA